MRTQSVLLVRDAVVALELRPTDDDGRYHFRLPSPQPLIPFRNSQSSRLVDGDNHAIDS